MKKAARDVEFAPAKEYAAWVKDIKERVRSTQLQAARLVNTQLIDLYWHIGREILDRQDRLGWGSKVVSHLSKDLLDEFPGTAGLSRSNLMYMRAFAAAWPDFEIVQASLGRLPWYQHIALVTKLGSREERLWYADASASHGWSRNVLVHQIESDLRQRQGAAITNFGTTLPPSQSEMAQQLTKDPYIFGTLGLGQMFLERELESALVQQMQKFLLELGRGFAFVGRQHAIEVGGQAYFLDLLFYNTRLHCYVVIELKIDDFKPEYVGKMQFYLSAVDLQLCTPGDNPTIGLILCKTRNGVVAEYALRDATKPMGVAEYRVGLPASLVNEMPSPKQLNDYFEAGDGE